MRSIPSLQFSGYPGGTVATVRVSLDARFRAALFSLVLALVITGCAIETAGPAPVNLVIWVDNPAIGSSVQQRIVPFMQEYPNIQVKVFDQFGRIQNGDVSVAIEALAGTQLAPDVVALTNEDFGLMSNPADLVDLRPYIDEENDFQSDDFFPTTLEAFQYQGKQLAIPAALDPWVVFYNQTLFDQAHIAPPSLDWTTGEFVEDGVRVEEMAGGKQEMAGFVTDPTQALLPFIEEFGVIPQDASVDPTARWLNEPGATDALQWFADLGLRQQIMPMDLGPRTLGLWYAGRAGMMAGFMDQRNQIPAFMLRRMGISVGGTPTATAGGVTPPAPGWKFKWGVTMMPRAEDQTTDYYLTGYGIPAASLHPDDAWLLINYLTSHLPEQPGTAYVPSRESLAKSKQFAALYPEPGHQAYIQSVEVGHPVPVLPPAAEPTEQDLAGALDGSVHPENALHAYQDRIQPILETPPTPTPTPIGGGG